MQLLNRNKLSPRAAIPASAERQSSASAETSCSRQSRVATLRYRLRRSRLLARRMVRTASPLSLSSPEIKSSSLRSPPTTSNNAGERPTPTSSTSNHDPQGEVLVDSFLNAMEAWNPGFGIISREENAKNLLEMSFCVHAQTRGLGQFFDVDK
ncbi:unnamed protein product [Amoebophrya sp. A25]|nr:unnamed protein product [Amoebophrya sp. A25]|eukprot:GSA25T00008341001.1